MKRKVTLFYYIFFIFGTLQAQVEPLTAEFQGQPGCQGPASLTILAHGGFPPYEYSIDGVNFQSSNKIILNEIYDSGTGTAFVRDSLGTLFSGIFTITPNVSYQDSEESILCGDDFYLGSSTSPTLTNLTKDTIFAYAYIDVKCTRIVYRVIIHVLPSYDKKDTLIIFAGTNFTFPDKVRITNILEDTVHVSQFKNPQGCDSIITTILQVYHPEELQTDTICKGSDYTFPDGTTQNNIEFPTTQHSYVRTKDSCIIDIITQLYIKEVDISISQSGNIFTANATDASYQWGYCMEENSQRFIPIPSQVSQTFQVSNNTYYAVEINQYGCKDTSSCLSMLITANVGAMGNEVNMYPNPVKETLNVEFPYDMGEILLQVFNTTGGKLYEEKLNNPALSSIPLNLASTGMYIVKITGKNSLKVLQFMKE